jgi:hypothetical protein
LRASSTDLPLKRVFGAERLKAGSRLGTRAHPNPCPSLQWASVRKSPPTCNAYRRVALRFLRFARRSAYHAVQMPLMNETSASNKDGKRSHDLQGGGQSAGPAFRECRSMEGLATASELRFWARRAPMDVGLRP